MLNEYRCIDEVASEETLVMICQYNNEYRLLVDSYYLGTDNRIVVKCDSLEDARARAKSLL